MGFDFGQYFDNSNDNNNQSVPTGNSQNLVEELIKSASQNYQQNATLTEEDIKRAFIQKYGSAEEFITKHFEKMTEPYEEAMLDAIIAKMEREKKSVYGSVATAAAIDVARNFNMRMLADNIKDESQRDQTSMKAAMLASTMNKLLPDGNPVDAMISIMAVLSVATVKLAEITMQLDAQEMAKKELGF